MKNLITLSWLILVLLLSLGILCNTVNMQKFHAMSGVDVPHVSGLTDPSMCVGYYVGGKHMWSCPKSYGSDFVKQVRCGFGRSSHICVEYEEPVFRVF